MSDDDEREKDETAPEAEESAPESARDSAPAEDEESHADDDEPRRSRPSRSSKAQRRARREEEARLAKRKSTMITSLVAVAALAAGGAAGWFAHIEQGKKMLRAESAPNAAGSATGACGAWEKKICASSGEQSAPCQQAKGATGLLTPTTCEAALEAVPATLAKIKAERLPCDDLVAKLCKDLPPGSDTCTMVKERTPMFQAQNCKEMLKNYDQVLAEVRQLDARPKMGMPGHGADDGHGH